MALWYALSAFGLVLLATGSLYWALTVNLDREDARGLENQLQNLRLLLSASPLDEPLTVPPGKGLSFQANQEIFVRLVDEHGRTVFETPGMAALAPPALFPQITDLDGQQFIRREVTSPSGRPFQTITAYAGSQSDSSDRRVFQLAVDREDEQRFLRKYRDLMMLVLAVAVVACAAAGIIIARGGIRPIERIVRTAREIRSATLHERIEIAGLPEELAQLAITFNDMLDRLEEAFERMSQFSADVAHELRTPVANLRGEVEVALGKERTPAEYQDVLGSCLEEFLRLSRIIQSLLFLAKAETTPALAHREQVELRQALAAVIDFFETNAAEASVSLQLQAGPPLWAKVDRTLIQQAVGNLISNAIAHTPAGGVIAILLTHRQDRVEIVVVDNGRGIAPEHLAHVFDRFYRANRARSGSAHNVGLGLTLVRSIVRLHGGSVDIDSTVGRGTRVTLRLPSVATAPSVAAHR